MLTRIKKIIISGGEEEADFCRVEEALQNSNRSIVKGFSMLAIIVLAVMLIISLMLSSFSSYRILYGVAFVVAVGIWYIAKYPGEKNSTLMLVDMYLFEAMLLGLGIVLGTVLSPKEISATYIALMLAVPELLTDRPYRMYVLIIFSVVVFVVMALHVKDPSTWNSDITNAILFGIISIILSTYSIVTRVSRYTLQEKIRFMAENDQLTGLRNRYCYEQSLVTAAVLESTEIFCVYVDVNGLHELNNSKGHEAGDRMLQFIASVMQHQFGEKDTYRIGGDEFVAIGSNKSVDEINDLVKAMKQAVESAGYHIAVGISFREKKGIEINNLVSEAEKEMYADKANYYQQNGIDRRNRR